MSVAALMGPGTTLLLLLLQESLKAFTLLEYFPELLLKVKPNPTLNEQRLCKAAWPLGKPNWPW